MPVMYNAQVFPRFFSTHKELGLAYLPEDTQIEQLKENRSMLLKASLCFIMDNDQLTLDKTPDCIVLKNQSAAWMRESNWGTGGNIEANASVLYGWWPATQKGADTSNAPYQPKMAPFCRGTMTKNLALPWTDHQSRDATWAVLEVFSFSPNLGNNFLNQTLDTVNSNPFDLWLLCGVNGSCTDLTPMVTIGGGKGEQGQVEYDFKGTLDKALGKGQESGSMNWNMDQVKYKSFAAEKYPSSPVCVWPPFL